VEHSFEIDLTRPAFKKDLLPVLVDLQQPAHRHTDHPHEGGNPQGAHIGDILCSGCGHTELDKDGRCACCGGLGDLGPLEAASPRNFQSTFKMEKLLMDEAMSLAFLSEEGMKLMAGEDHHHAVLEHFGAEAARRLQTRHPFVFHPTRWAQTAAAMDELMIRWNNLPRIAKVKMFLPGLSAEEIVNLRSLRHAPRTVFANGGSELRLDVTEVTYLPIPPVQGNRQAALISIELPEGIKAGQVFTVDVSQLRAGSTVENGAFRIEIPIGKARHIFPAVERNLVLTMERLSLTPARDRWRPILERRLQTERRRARALAERLNLPEWKDPTQWVDEQGRNQPVTGMKIRVVLEKIKILEACEPWWKGAGEVDFEASAWTPDNGGILQHTRLPQTGQWKARTGDVLNIETVIFEGIVRDRLNLKIRGMERDFLDPDDHLVVFHRNFSCDPDQWIKQYMPGDEKVDPEDLEYFQLWYRIEKG
jgi:hypothetical protein